MTLKDALFAACRRTGLLAMIRDSEWRRRRLLILCYHGVSLRDEHEWNDELYVPAALLRRRLQHLRDEGYNVLPLADACRRLAAGTLPKRSVALTFDDGTVDFKRVAVPLLQEFEIPATVYLTTYYSDVRLPVFDTVLAYVLWKGRSSGGDVGPLCDCEIRLPVATSSEREVAHERLRDHAAREGLSATSKDDLVAKVADRLGVSYAEIVESEVLRIMSAEDVAALPADLVDVQLHTHRHRMPPTRALFMRELHDNARLVRRSRGTGATLAHFCYPSGVYRGDVLPWLREAGIEFATTCVPGIASATDNPLLLPRFIDTALHSPTVFEAWTSGFAGWLPKRRAYRLDENLLHHDASAARSDERRSA